MPRTNSDRREAHERTTNYQETPDHYNYDHHHHHYNNDYHHYQGSSFQSFDGQQEYNTGSTNTTSPFTMNNGNPSIETVASSTIIETLKKSSQMSKNLQQQQDDSYHKEGNKRIILAESLNRVSIRISVCDAVRYHRFLLL